ncbi:hypothetical protein C8R44DRAFT_221096 [Mycena epipterygia]|nr:hypothetical protein C8R44DRAFT_221096 [Mycena epipterygia]
MSHRNHSNKHALPANPAFIDFPRSDGDSGLWPQNTTQELDEEGCVNFMQHVNLDEPIAIKWRVGVGDAISVALKLPGGQPYVLRDFPSGYRMFDHHKGKVENPRHDVYLFGSDSRARFRSVPEFIPHAIWLMGDENDPCKCKYCSKKPQREITSSMGNLLRSSQSPSPSRPPRYKLEKVERKKDILSSKRSLADRLQNEKTYAAIQKTSIPKPSPHIQTKNTMLVERNNNLRDASRLPPKGGLPRWFREGELVWCALETPIVGPASKDAEAEIIKFWPAIIDEVKLTIHRDPVPTESVPAGQPSTAWGTRQTTSYKVQFLAISRSYLFSDSMVIPYQSHLTSAGILRLMVDRPIDDWDFSQEKLSSFDPSPPTGLPPTFSDTLNPFAVALQIASMFSGFWCLTDDWDAKLALPPGPARPVPPHSSLQSAIEFAGSNNAYGGSISSGPNPSRPPPPARVVTQTRFQGLWWGGERIWTDDLVRLKVPRNCLAPAGGQHIFAPSGPGSKCQGLIATRGSDPSSYGAISRGVFMKIDAIFIVDGATKRECRVSGMLYELADQDWEDPNLPRNVESISNGVPPTAPLASSSSIGQSAKPTIPSVFSGESFPLPPAPDGYKFRPILSPGHEAVLSLSLISGRYYPRLLQHPLILPNIDDIMPYDATSMLSAAHLFALEGLFGGYKNSVDPLKYKAHREKMISDATQGALNDLEQHIRGRRQDANQMEVD